MILVVGRPRLGERGELEGNAARVALAAAQAGGRVELVGSVGDDAAGEAAALALGRAGVGHAALLRDPAAQTARQAGKERLPRLDANDLQLGLSYLADCRVLVLAESLEPAAQQVALEAADYHGAWLIMLHDGEREPPTDLPAKATVLGVPQEDGGAFTQLVGRYAAALARGEPAERAWQDALAGSGWEEPAGATVRPSEE